MSFTEAVRQGFAKYATFSGRARRSEYWYWVLFVALATFGVFMVLGTTAAVIVGDDDPDLHDGTFTLIGLAFIVWVLAMVPPTLAVSARRLHDTSRPAGYLLLLPALVVWFCEESHHDNQFGPNPKRLGYGIPGHADGGYGYSPYPQSGYGQPGYGPPPPPPPPAYYGPRGYYGY